MPAVFRVFSGKNMENLCFPSRDLNCKNSTTSLLIAETRQAEGSPFEAKLPQHVRRDGAEMVLGAVI